VFLFWLTVPIKPWAFLPDRCRGRESQEIPLANSSRRPDRDRRRDHCADGIDRGPAPDGALDSASGTPIPEISRILENPSLSDSGR